jgi:signal transduction histidine kinase
VRARQRSERLSCHRLELVVGQTHHEVRNLHEAAKRELFAALAENRKPTVDREAIDLVAMVDRRALHQAVQNLVKNAIEASVVGAERNVIVRGRYERDGTLVIVESRRSDTRWS